MARRPSLHTPSAGDRGFGCRRDARPIQLDARLHVIDGVAAELLQTKVASVNITIASATTPAAGTTLMSLRS
jgi:hypothetical protein